MNNQTILVVGGAGYIGSHTSWLLHQQGYNVIVLDKLVHKQTFNQSWARLIKSDFSNEQTLKTIFTENKIDCVMHFAAFIEVGESVKNPKDFYQNNVTKTLTLLNSMLEHGVNKFIFSSSCAVYGVPQKLPLEETHQFAPVSPYGKNKLVIEYALQDYAKAYGLQYISLRYFNASGACPEKMLGEWHIPETHVIPKLLRAAMNNQTFLVCGDDYSTQDGTCIRDYVHVLDIGQAHIQAYEHLNKTGISDCFNLGSEYGFSIKQLISAAEQICKTKIKIGICNRRPGDVPILIANASKAQKILGWQAKNSSIENILKSALEWENILIKTKYFSLTPRI
ncbi:MAG: ExoB [candidate division TM6 bacterium GW2011_GWF2_37_49]|nr:MAG: ExoB [candidate division TM6 bacterium GW2011_GWF2_37_49]